MVSLPSGFHDDVELVKIETNEVSLVIKGKPFHARYESFKNYQRMNFTDRMVFEVRGESVSDVQVFHVEAAELGPPGNLRPIFFENGVYQVLISPKNGEQISFYHEYPKFRNAVKPTKLGGVHFLMGNLQFANEVGLSEFTIMHGDKEVLSITMEVFPVKLDYRTDYVQLLQEVNDEIYNLAFHFIKRTFLAAKLKLDGEPSQAEFYRLITYYFKQYVQAIEQIGRQPHHTLEKTYEKARADKLNKQDARTRKYVRKNPHLFENVANGMDIFGVSKLPMYGLRIKKEINYETNENRLVKWMTERLIDKLVDLRKKISVDYKTNSELMSEVFEMITVLENQMNLPFWRSLKPIDRTVMSLVMQMAPGYRDAYQIFLTLSKGLELHNNMYRMSIKDIATLYEYWTFLKIGRILKKNYIAESQDIIKVNQQGLFIRLEPNERAKQVFSHPITGEKITLIYQNSYSDLPTTRQIPDSVLQIEKKGKGYTFNYIFDAKYRIDYGADMTKDIPGPLEEDINTMHRYRDAIVSGSGEEYERSSFGAYVLFPFSDEETYQGHAYYKSINKMNIGALPFLPNATTLVEVFIDNIINKSPEEIHREGILPVGLVDVFRLENSDKVMVCLVDSVAGYQDTIVHSRFSMSRELLRKGWQEAKYIALYLKQGIAAENGVTVYGKIGDVRLNGDEVIFKIDVWRNLDRVIPPVNYGIATYVMTTIDALLEAQELPELFIKSQEEMQIWRMLRRVSDKIETNLDAVLMDEASVVKSFQVKDILVSIEEERVSFSRGEVLTAYSFESLKREPTAVFRDLVGMLSE